MVYLKKEEIFFERDEKGELLPIETILETIPDKPTIVVTPLTKGELAKIVAMSGTETDNDTDIDIVIQHCRNPVFTDEDRESLKKAGKSLLINAIAIAIFSISTGIGQSQLLEEGKKSLTEKKLQNFQSQ